MGQFVFMITLTHHYYLSGSPAELMAIEAMYETVRAGYLTGMHISPQNEVIVAYEDGIPAAIVVFVEYEESAELWIHMGYCRPEYRRQGHYRACIDKLKILAAERGFSRIHTAAHPENKAAIASITARGGTVQYVGFVFPV